MRRERMNPQGEMPSIQVEDLRHTGNPIQVRWDFLEETDEMEGGDPIISWSFLVVTVENLNVNTLQAADVPQPIIEQIEQAISDYELNDTEALNIILGQ